MNETIGSQTEELETKAQALWKTLDEKGLKIDSDSKGYHNFVAQLYQKGFEKISSMPFDVYFNRQDDGQYVLVSYKDQKFRQKTVKTFSEVAKVYSLAEKMGFSGVVYNACSSSIPLAIAGGVILSFIYDRGDLSGTIALVIAGVAAGIGLEVLRHSFNHDDYVNLFSTKKNTEEE